jgi:hypothetical protein
MHEEASMFRTLLWTLGLGLPVTALFGQTAGSIAAAIGFAIGASLRTRRSQNRSAPTINEKSLARDSNQDEPYNPNPTNSEPFSIGDEVPTSSPRNPSYTRSYRNARKPTSKSFYRLALGIAASLVIVVALFAFFRNDDDHDQPPENISDLPNRPTVTLPEMWNRELCLKENFKTQIAEGRPIPPEAHLYCTYPWRMKRLSQVLESINGNGVSMIDIFDGYKHRTPELEIVKAGELAILANPNVNKDLVVVHQLARIIPLLWEAKSGTFKELNETFQPDLVNKFKVAAAGIPWNETIANAMHHDISLSLGDSEAVRFVTDRVSSPTWEDFSLKFLRVLGGKWL